MNYDKTYDVIIIGAGPAGMAAAIYASKASCRVLLLDRLDKVGKKLLVTGNGRCNITNLNQRQDCYRSQNPDRAWDIISHFNEKALIALLRHLGIVLKDRDGYVYPNNDQAATVREAIEEYLMNQPDLVIKTGKSVDHISFHEQDKLFHINGNEYMAPNLIIATGGLAGVHLGCQGDGYTFAKVFGHQIIPTGPALTALCSKAPFLKRLSGVRCHAEVSIVVDDEVLCKEEGELQWTDYGISGVLIFSLSRFAIRAMEAGKTTKAIINFAPDLTEQNLYALLAWPGDFGDYKVALTLLNGFLPHKLSPVILREAGIAQDMLVREMEATDFSRLIKVLKGFELRISGYKSYEKAQTTMGGIPLTELTDQMESIYQQGLFFAGEVADVDGTCGGYNLQWAFSSGKAAGEAAGERSKSAAY